MKHFISQSICVPFIIMYFQTDFIKYLFANALCIQLYALGSYSLSGIKDKRSFLIETW